MFSQGQRAQMGCWEANGTSSTLDSPCLHFDSIDAQVRNVDIAHLGQGSPAHVKIAAVFGPTRLTQLVLFGWSLDGHKRKRLATTFSQSGSNSLISMVGAV